MTVVPRVARQELAGGVHHVTARGTGERVVFRDDVDRRVFMKLLRRTLDRATWRCLTYCLMGNHYHLLVQTPEPTLGVGMQWLNGVYAQYVNHRHSLSGHLWANRYYSVVLKEDSHLLSAVRYIAMNPVRAGLCRAPEEWPWSGHRALAGLGPRGCVDVETTLAYFSAHGGDSRARYRTFVVGET